MRNIDEANAKRSYRPKAEVCAVSGSQGSGTPDAAKELAGVLRDLKAAHNRLLWILQNWRGMGTIYVLVADSYLQKAIEKLSEGVARAGEAEK